MFKRSLISLLFFVGLAGQVFAGPQYVDGTGYAVSGYDVVAYFNGGPVAGKKEFSTEYNGAKFSFSTEANLKTFQADPAKYVPAYDGHCSYGVSLGGKVPGNLKKSTANWPKLEPIAASTRVIPAFTSMAPN
jgi:YHS domain-containing protein